MTSAATRNRTNAIPNQAICLASQFSKLGAAVDVREILRVEITTRDPRSGSYNPSVDLRETIPGSSVVKVATGKYEYTTSPATIVATGTFYDVVHFTLEENGPELMLINSFSVTADGLPKLGYVTVAEVRAEGLTDEEKYPDDLINSRIQYNTKLIENYTGQFFEARKLLFMVDGYGSFNIQLDIPIIHIDKMEILEPVSSHLKRFDIRLEDIRIYNRHITSGLTEPDDRENPMIGNVYLPKGRQNILIEGTFGYTEQDGSTPLMIKRALILMVLKDKDLLASNKRQSMLMGLSGRLRSESTDGHSYSLAVATPVQGSTPYFTGDEEVDHILHNFRKPFGLGRGLGANVTLLTDRGSDFNQYYGNGGYSLGGFS